MNPGKEISSQLVVARGDSTKVFEFVEEALDEIAFAVERVVACTLHFTVGLGRNHRGDPSPREGVEQRIGIISLVAEEGVRVGVFACQVVILTRRQHQFDRIAQGINKRMDFGRQSPAGSPNGLRAVFFRAPALCWWARTMVASIIMYSLSGSLANSLKMRSKTPLLPTG